jgi:GNAT superfamily N-acetyltransferase
MEDIHIETFTDEYSSVVKQLVLKVLEEFSFPYHPEWDADLDKIQQEYDGRSGFWIAIHGKKVIGTIALQEDSIETGILKRMYVLERYRGKGVGLKLIHHATNFAKEQGYKEIILDTTSVMVRARKLYENYGFNKIKESKIQIFYRLKL